MARADTRAATRPVVHLPVTHTCYTYRMLLLHFPTSKPVDVVAAAFRSKAWRFGRLSVLTYTLMPGQFHPRRLLRIRVHVQCGPRCVEVAI